MSATLHFGFQEWHVPSLVGEETETNVQQVKNVRIFRQLVSCSVPQGGAWSLTDLAKLYSEDYYWRGRSCLDNSCNIKWIWEKMNE